MQYRLVVMTLGIIALLAPPVAAQENPEDPGLAPAIGVWAGAARGVISNVDSGEDTLTLSATVRDPDSAQAIDYQVLVDGQVSETGTTSRPNGFGRNINIETTVDVDPGLHRVCLRLADRLTDERSINRTVNCRTTLTAPPQVVSDAVVDAANGVVVSETGVVLPVLSGTDGRYQVQTPCGAETTVTSGEFIDRARVVIDPGHGGSESGAVGAGLQEKNVNLVVSNVVVEKFEALGISAELTRESDYRLPIRTRADIASSLAPDVFLSLHHNGGAVRRSSVPGTEVFYGEGRPESERLARILYEELHTAAAQFDANWVSTVNQGASLRLRGDGADLFGIHRFSPDIDSVITEFLYLSNPSEAQLMTRPDVIEAQAQAIVDGIVRWWFSEDAGTSLGREFVDGSSSGTGGFDGCTDPALTSFDASLDATDRSDVVAEANQTVTAPSLGQSLFPALFLAQDPAVTLSRR